jgi:hypothetical protein
MSTPITPNLPSAADLDAVASDQAAAQATSHPQATAPAHPQPELQTSAPGVAPESLPNPTSHGHGEKGGPTAPSLDTEVFDDAGNEKTDQGIGDEGFGPRGHNIPRDVMSDAERQQQADDAEAKLKAGLAPTNIIDSTGAPKGAFQVTPQGHDKHGMRLPDKIDTTKVMEPVAPHVGPRGVGAPQDCFHGPRPEKK